MPRVITPLGVFGFVVAVLIFALAPLAVDQINGDPGPLTADPLGELPLAPP